METSISSLYRALFEGIFKFSVPARSRSISNPTSSNDSHTDTPNERKIKCYRVLPDIFQRILLFWRNATSSKSWALEKLTDIFCSDITTCPEILAEQDLTNFVKGFFDEKEGLTLYPDFVMNEVSKMLTAMILSDKIIPDNLKQSAINIIRSSLDYGLINKGHRLHIAFQSLQQLFKNPAVAYDLMHMNEYDASFALTVSLVSGHNYTRKSAKDYFVMLVKFAYDDTTVTKEDPLFHDNLKVAKMKSDLKQVVNKTLCAYNEKLVACCENRLKTESTSASYDRNIIANYCEILCLCADECEEWCNKFEAPEHCSLFDVILSLLKDLKTKDYYCDPQFTTSSIQTLIRLLTMEDSQKIRKENVEKLFNFVSQSLGQKDSSSSLSELMQSSHLLLSQCDYHDTFSKTLLELSLLPLLSVLHVPLTCSQHLNSEIIEKFVQKLRSESPGNLHVLIDLAVRTAFEADQRKVEPPVLSFINYITLKTLDCPSNISQPFLNHNEIRNAESLVCVLSCLKHMTPILYNNFNEVKRERKECIGHYVEALFNSTFTSHKDLHLAFDCFLALLYEKQRAHESQTYPVMRILSFVIASLQLHMVSVNLNIREEAVKCIKELFLLDDISITQELTDAKAVISLWQCVKDQAESVVVQVLDFILCVTTRGKLASLLPCVDLTLETLTREVQCIILSSPWDTARSTGFHILATISQTSSIVRYAEILMGLENPNLTEAVIKFMEKLFAKFIANDNKEKDVEDLCDLLVAGWGDLLLSTLTAHDTHAFRYTIDILVSLHKYFMNPTVNETFNKMLNVSITRENGKEQREVEKDSVVKEKLLSFWKELIQSIKTVESRQERADEGNNCEPLTKVMKIEEKICSSNLSESELFLCKVAKCNKENVLKNYRNWLLEINNDLFRDEYFIDSTKELAPLKLETRPFPCQQLVYTILDSTEINLNSSTSRLLTFLNFKEILDSLNTHALHEEAHRSTDQYARNENTILEDLDTLLEKAFSQTSYHLESAIVKIFISDVLDMVVSLLESKGDDFKNALISLDSIVAKMSHFLLSRRLCLEFIISQKKTVFLVKWTAESSQFILDAVLERLNYLQTQGTHGLALKEFYPNEEDLKVLLDMYINEKYTNQLTIPASQSIIMTDNPENSTEETSVILTNIDSLKKTLDVIMQENQKCAQTIFDWLKKVYEILRLCLKQSVDVKENLQGLLTLVSKMDQWFSNDDDDEFDHDNDPTLIDCF